MNFNTPVYSNTKIKFSGKTEFTELIKTSWKFIIQVFRNNDESLRQIDWHLINKLGYFAVRTFLFAFKFFNQIFTWTNYSDQNFRRTLVSIFENAFS